MGRGHEPGFDWGCGVGDGGEFLAATSEATSVKVVVVGLDCFEGRRVLSSSLERTASSISISPRFYTLTIITINQTRSIYNIQIKILKVNTNVNQLSCSVSFRRDCRDADVGVGGELEEGTEEGGFTSVGGPVDY